MLRFQIEIADELVQRLEAKDDTVFTVRLKAIIISELSGYNSDFPTRDVRVIELPGIKLPVSEANG